jgi:hypothetical protein
MSLSQKHRSHFDEESPAPAILLSHRSSSKEADHLPGIDEEQDGFDSGAEANPEGLGGFSSFSEDPEWVTSPSNPRLVSTTTNTSDIADSHGPHGTTAEASFAEAPKNKMFMSFVGGRSGSLRSPHLGSQLCAAAPRASALSRPNRLETDSSAALAQPLRLGHASSTSITHHNRPGAFSSGSLVRMSGLGDEPLSALRPATAALADNPADPLSGSVPSGAASLDASRLLRRTGRSRKANASKLIDARSYMFAVWADQMNVDEVQVQVKLRNMN